MRLGDYTGLLKICDFLTFIVTLARMVQFSKKKLPKRYGKMRWRYVILSFSDFKGRSHWLRPKAHILDDPSGKPSDSLKILFGPPYGPYGPKKVLYGSVILPYGLPKGSSKMWALGLNRRLLPFRLQANNEFYSIFMFDMSLERYGTVDNKS